MESASREIFPAAVNILLLSVRPLAADILIAPAETNALFTLIVEAVEVRFRPPDEEVLPAARVKAPAELKVMPLANDKVEEFAFIFKTPDEVEILLFKLIPEFAVRTTAPAAVILPVKVILDGVVKVKAPAAFIPPLAALNEISAALFNVIPLAKVI